MLGLQGEITLLCLGQGQQGVASYMVEKVCSGAGRGFIGYGLITCWLARPCLKELQEQLEQQRQHCFHLCCCSALGSQVMSRACASLLKSQLGSLARKGECQVPSYTARRPLIFWGCLLAKLAK